MLDHYESVKDLLWVSKIFATIMYRSLTKEYPELYEVARSDLMEYWDYFIPMATVGFGFILIADNFQSDVDRDNFADAFEKVLNEWKVRPIKYNNFDVMKNFLNTFNSMQKDGLPIDASIGGWIWINLNVEKANQKLKEITQKEFYVKMLGLMILETFHDWWKLAVF